MTAKTRNGGWLPNFRRAMGHLGPHRRPLVIGLIAAVGVSVFYTFTVTSVIPVLKIIFAEHESLVQWMQRSETQRRLGVVLGADLPDDPAGLVISNPRDTSPNTKVLPSGARITGLSGEPLSSWAVSAAVARASGEAFPTAQVRYPDGSTQTVTLHLEPNRWWWNLAESAAAWLPTGQAGDTRFRTLVVVMVAMVVIALLGGICRFVNDGLVATAVLRAMHDLRTRLAEHTLRLPMDWHSTHPAGDTLARFATDIDKVRVGMTTLFGKVIREPLKAVGLLFIALLLDWRMLVVGVVGLPIGALAIRAFGKMVKRAQRSESESWGRLLDHLGERLGGIRVVKAANMQHAESERFAGEDLRLTRAQTHIELVDAASNPVLETLAVLAVSGFIIYGGYRVIYGELDPSALFGAVICLGGIFDPLRKLGNVNNRLQSAEASAQRLFDLLDLPVEAAERDATAGELKPFENNIEFRGITYAYPSNPARPVLRDVTLRVERGQVVALVGPNGSGKTTLVSLLMRFFEPTAGEIRIDGQPIAGVSLASLRKQIGLVTQEAIVFSGTVRENIAYGCDGVATSALEAAARVARVEEFVREMQVEHDGQATLGYDAWVSGRTLSGGQRQRIVLARAVLRDPPILVLDEATSQVDAESERKIQDALEELMKDRTTFIIAHRFSTIARADLTVVLNEGRVIGIGQHEALLRTCPFYETLVKTQFANGV